MHLEPKVRCKETEGKITLSPSVITRILRLRFPVTFVTPKGYEGNLPSDQGSLAKITPYALPLTPYPFGVILASLSFPFGDRRRVILPSVSCHLW